MAPKRRPGETSDAAAKREKLASIAGLRGLSMAMLARLGAADVQRSTPTHFGAERFPPQ